MIPKEVLRKVRQIEIRTNREVTDVLGGQYHSVFKGHGMEFEEVREYLPGDEVRAEGDFHHGVEAQAAERAHDLAIVNFHELGGKAGGHAGGHALPGGEQGLHFMGRAAQRLGPL